MLKKRTFLNENTKILHLLVFAKFGVTQTYGQVVTCIADAYVFGACANLAGGVADEMMGRLK